MDASDKGELSRALIFHNSVTAEALSSVGHYPRRWILDQVPIGHSAAFMLSYRNHEQYRSVRI